MSGKVPKTSRGIPYGDKTVIRYGLIKTGNCGLRAHLYWISECGTYGKEAETGKHILFRDDFKIYLTLLIKVDCRKQRNYLKHTVLLEYVTLYYESDELFGEIVLHK